MAAPTRLRIRRATGCERCVEDLIAILDALAVERTHLLGYSMGGRVALAAAIAHPERIASLILESASPGLADAAERQARIASDNGLAESGRARRYRGVRRAMGAYAAVRDSGSAARGSSGAAAGAASGQPPHGIGEQFARARHRSSAAAMGALGRVEASLPDHGGRTGRQVHGYRAQDGGCDRRRADSVGRGCWTYHSPRAARGIHATGDGVFGRPQQ